MQHRICHACCFSTCSQTVAMSERLPTTRALNWSGSALTPSHDEGHTLCPKGYWISSREEHQTVHSPRAQATFSAPHSSLS